MTSSCYGRYRWHGDTGLPPFIISTNEIFKTEDYAIDAIARSSNRNYVHYSVFQFRVLAFAKNAKKNLCTYLKKILWPRTKDTIRMLYKQNTCCERVTKNHHWSWKALLNFSSSWQHFTSTKLRVSAQQDLDPWMCLHFIIVSRISLLFYTPFNISIVFTSLIRIFCRDVWRRGLSTYLCISDHLW